MARYKTEQKEQTKERIIAAAGRCFKKGGYSGIGVDGLAKEAGVTSGAFYGHFDSKNEAFKAAVNAGMEELLDGVGQLKAQFGETWWQEFAKFYMGQKRTCDLSEGCALQALTPEIARSDETVRSEFEQKLIKLVKLASDSNLHGDNNKTWANLAMLIGGVTLARAVANESLATEIALAIQNSINNK
jgi:TetR/AcrR family transcriptional regulator, transcriptional repressor for nem operon